MMTTAEIASKLGCSQTAVEEMPFRFFYLADGTAYTYLRVFKKWLAGEKPHLLQRFIGS